MSPRTGRPKIENPKNARLEVRLTQEELQMLEECAKELGKNKSEVILKGIEIVHHLIERKKGTNGDVK